MTASDSEQIGRRDVEGARELGEHLAARAAGLAPALQPVEFLRTHAEAVSELRLRESEFEATGARLFSEACSKGLTASSSHVASLRNSPVAVNRKITGTPETCEAASVFAVPRVPMFESHYPLGVVRAEVAEVIGEAHKLRATEEQMAEAIGIDKFEFSRKKNAQSAGRFFNVVQLGSLIGFFYTKGIVLPPGWPLTTRAEWKRIKHTLEA